MTNSGLVLNDLRISLRGQEMLRLTTSVAAGEVLSIMGPSGAGKSTLLAAVMGTLSPDFTVSGQIVLNGRDVTNLPTQDRCVGILFQDPLLFPHLSVGSNLAFGLPRSVRGKERRLAIEKGLEQVGLDGFSGRDPATLSGGQKVRVALMRTLLSEPAALLLDEPFSSLDADRRAQMRRLVFDRVKRAGLPALLVTHDAVDAEAAGGPILTL